MAAGQMRVSSAYVNEGSVRK
ncbi:hypothetical protein CCACVL1_01113, partial [Corchorus capsularis]